MSIIPFDPIERTRQSKIEKAYQEFVRFYRSPIVSDQAREYADEFLHMMSNAQMTADEAAASIRRIIQNAESYREPHERISGREVGWLVDLFSHMDREAARGVQVRLTREAIGLTQPSEQSIKIEILDEDGIENLPQFEYMIDGLITKDSIGVVFGPPGSGKSFVMASMAMCVADGRPWLGRPVQGGPVVYMTGGEGRPGWKARIQALKRHYGIDRTRYGFHMIPHSMDLRDPVAIDVLIRELERIRPAWIIVDTLVRHMPGGDDNSSRDVGQVLENCNRIKEATGASVAIVHHPTKSDEEEERGSSALRGFVDYSICVKRYIGTGNILLKSIKDKYAENFQPFRVMLQTVELPGGPTPVVVEADPVQSLDGPALNEKQKLFYDALKDYPGSTIGEIIASSGLPRGTAYRIRDQLLEKGIIKEDPETKRLEVVEGFEW